MTYSRSNPSPRYQALLAQYRDLHVNGERTLGLPPERTFDGHSLFAQLQRIRALAKATGARTVLDYGSGKGTQYGPVVLKDADGTAYDDVMDFWDVDSVHCYDPAYQPFSTPPTGQFDGVICTDVLEHCPEEDMPWILGTLFEYARLFVFANVACYPARKHLPNGENAHCTIRPVEWWADLLQATASRHPGVRWEVWVQSRLPGEPPRLTEQRLQG